MATQIRIRRGQKANLPTLAVGEQALCTDTNEVYIGTNSGNKLVGSGIVGSAAVSSSVYDVVIRTQEEFEALYNSATWLDAKSVAFVGRGAQYDFQASAIVTIPATVKRIDGFNGVIISASMGYAEQPSENDGYSISNLKLVPSSSVGYSGMKAFFNCVNLTNCIGRLSGPFYTGYGFYNCNRLVNCVGYAAGQDNLYGFYNCTQLTNCIGTGRGQPGYAFGFCSYANGCKEGAEQAMTQYMVRDKYIYRPAIMPNR